MCISEWSLCSVALRQWTDVGVHREGSIGRPTHPTFSTESPASRETPGPTRGLVTLRINPVFVSACGSERSQGS